MLVSHFAVEGSGARKTTTLSIGICTTRFPTPIFLAVQHQHKDQSKISSRNLKPSVVNMLILFNSASYLQNQVRTNLWMWQWAGLQPIHTTGTSGG